MRYCGIKGLPFFLFLRLGEKLLLVQVRRSGQSRIFAENMSGTTNSLSWQGVGELSFKYLYSCEQTRTIVGSILTKGRCSSRCAFNRKGRFVLCSRLSWALMHVHELLSSVSESSNAQCLVHLLVRQMEERHKHNRDNVYGWWWPWACQFTWYTSLLL